MLGDAIVGVVLGGADTPLVDPVRSPVRSYRYAREFGVEHGARGHCCSVLTRPMGSYEVIAFQLSAELGIEPGVVVGAEQEMGSVQL